MKNLFLHSTYYLLHSFLIVAFTVVLFSATAPVANAAGGVKIDPSYHPSNAPTITGEAAGSVIEKNLTVENARVQFFARIINVILGIVGVISIFALINNAWWLAASAGQEEALTQRKKGLKWAVIGLILVILSYSIVRWMVTIGWQAHEAPATPLPPPSTTETSEKPAHEYKFESGGGPSADELQYGKGSLDLIQKNVGA